MRPLSRRTFVKTSAIAAAGAMLPSRSWSQVLGANADIRVAVSAEDERAYFEDAYKVLQKVAGTASGGMSMTNAAHLTVTNRATRRRINEADLVRLSKIGQTPDDEFATTPAHDSEPVKPIVHDPALARAIDLLKGLAVVQAGRPI